MKTGSRIFNRILNRRYYTSYLDRGMDWRMWRELRRQSRKMRGSSLQEVLTVNNIIPDEITIIDMDKIKTIDDKVIDKKTERDDIGNIKPKQ